MSYWTCVCLDLCPVCLSVSARACVSVCPCVSAYVPCVSVCVCVPACPCVCVCMSCLGGLSPACPCGVEEQGEKREELSYDADETKVSARTSGAWTWHGPSELSAQDKEPGIVPQAHCPWTWVIYGYGENSEPSAASPPAVGVSASSPCLGPGPPAMSVPWHVETSRRGCMGSHPCGSLSPVCAPGRLTPVVMMSLRPPHPVVRSEAGSLSQWPCRTVVPPMVSQACVSHLQLLALCVLPRPLDIF